MSRFRRKLAALLALCLLLAGLVGGTALWLQTQRRQHRLNRQLIAVLVKSDTQQALALVNAGADPNTRYTPMPAPSLTQMVNALLHRSTRPASASYGPTALMIACGGAWKPRDNIFMSMIDQDDARLTGAMILHGADVNAHDEQGWTPLADAVMYAYHPDTARLLLEHGANVNAPITNGWTPLMVAAFTRPSMDGRHLKHETDINGQDPYGVTLRLLLQHGANVNAQDRYGMTALAYAVRAPTDNNMIQHLLEQGADPNLANKQGKTPLMLAQQFKGADRVALLKHAGAQEPQKRP